MTSFLSEADDFDDFEEPDDHWDDDDSTETIRCPHCAADVYEDAEQCPVCGEYIMPSTSVWADRPWWWIVLGIAGILAVIVALSSIGAFF